jgi:hypothetical protein
MNDANRGGVLDPLLNPLSRCLTRDGARAVLELRFHVDHVRPRQRGGSNMPENLALACHRCDLHRGSNLSGIDSDTSRTVPLVHPHRDRWTEHFAPEGERIVDRTPVGRTTVWLPQRNSEERVELRRVLIELGEWD